MTSMLFQLDAVQHPEWCTSHIEQYDVDGMITHRGEQRLLAIPECDLFLSACLVQADELVDNEQAQGSPGIEFTSNAPVGFIPARHLAAVRELFSEVGAA